MNKTHINPFATSIAVGVAMMIIVSSSIAQSVSPSELQFREALHKQQVEGDLVSAIKIYQNIVGSKDAERPVKAKALLQLAACYEKLGRQSEVVYQQIIKEYGEQPAANQARARLAALRPPTPPAAMTMRKIETGPGVQNVVATDGQRALYWDSTNSILYIGDLGGKDRREVYRTKRVPMTVPSRDLGMIFFFLPNSQEGPAMYAVIKSDGTGYRELVVTEHRETIPVGTIGIAPPACVSWSWDNRYLLMCKRTPASSKTRLLKITVADGTAEDMLPDSTGSVSDAQFSPDGRFIAYHAGNFLGPVQIMPSQGGASQLIAENGALIDWTRDGRYLMIGESRPGATDLATASLTAVPIRNGQSFGDLIPIQASLPPSNGLPRITPNGAIVLQVGTGPTQQVMVGSFDTQDHFGPWKPLELVEGGVGMAWSPDSRQIVYVARGPMSLLSVVRVRSVDGSEDRELYRSNEPVFGCVWARLHPIIYCAQPGRAKTVIVSIALDSGRAEKVGELDGTRLLHFITPDDRFLYTAKLEGPTSLEWEIGTDRERRSSIFRTPDGRWALGFAAENGRRYITARRADIDGQAPRRLVELNTQDAPDFAPVPARITEDGQWVIYSNKDPDGKLALYRIATSGGEPQRLADFPSPDSFNMTLVSPDGKRMIVGTTGPPRKIEFWALENFLPAASPNAPVRASQPRGK